MTMAMTGTKRALRGQERGAATQPPESCEGVIYVRGPFGFAYEQAIAVKARVLGPASEAAIVCLKGEAVTVPQGLSISSVCWVRLCVCGHHRCAVKGPRERDARRHGQHRPRERPHPWQTAASTKPARHRAAAATVVVVVAADTAPVTAAARRRRQRNVQEEKRLPECPRRSRRRHPGAGGFHAGAVAEV